MHTVRTASTEDLPGIVTRWKELIATHALVDPVMYALAPHALETYAAYVRRRVEDRDSLVLVADPARGRAHGEPSAYLVAGLGERAAVFKVREVGMIFDLVVTESLRRTGLGRMLVHAAENWFRLKGMQWSQCDFAPDNPSSASFWPRMGYTVLLQEAYRRL